MSAAGISAAALRAAAVKAPLLSPLQIALDLAAGGIPSFPCGANKRPAIPEHEGGHGFHDASADPDTLRALFARAPRAKLVGVPTGDRSGIDIMDIDPRHDGHLWEAAHADQLPDTLIHQTGGGGRHYAFQHADGVTNRTGCPAPGVDVRGAGGYAIWPPSAGYSVVNEAPIAPWPPWLLELVRRPAPPPRPAFVAADPSKITDQRLNGLVRALLDRVSRAPEGLKHDTLLRIARTLGGYQHLLDHTEAQLASMLLDALPDTVADWKNAEKTALDGLRHGAQSPLTLAERPPSGTHCGNGSGPGQTGPMPGHTARQTPPPTGPGIGAAAGGGSGERVPPQVGSDDGADEGGGAEDDGQHKGDKPDGAGETKSETETKPKLTKAERGALLEHLADLDTGDFEDEREAAAERLHWRLGVLEKEVEKIRQARTDAEAAAEAATPTAAAAAVLAARRAAGPPPDTDAVKALIAEFNRKYFVLNEAGKTVIYAPQGCSTLYLGDLRGRVRCRNMVDKLRGLDCGFRARGRSPKPCVATHPPGYCLAIIRPSDRLAEWIPTRAGAKESFIAALRSAVLDPRRGHRRQFLSFHRNLHHGAPPPAEHRLRSTLEARRPIPPFATSSRSIRRPSSRPSAASAAGLLDASTVGASQRTIALDGKSAQAKLRQLHRPQSSSTAARVRHQSRPGPGAYRYRREVQRDPLPRPAIAWRTPGRAQHHHAS